MVLCTYCGSLSIRTDKCSNCNGHFDLLSRQRTQNGMGPWFIRDHVNPFHPGCSYETLRRLVSRGRVRPDTVMRGPTTRQFWSFARNTPGVAHLLGACHACHVPVDSTAVACPSCSASFVVVDDRQQLGLAPIQMLPGDADPSAIADAAFGPAPIPAQADAAARAGLERAPTDPSEDAAAVAGQAAPLPRRRRSKGPMVAVVASVGCAVVALAAVVYMNRSDSTTGSASAAESRPQSIPTEASPERAEARPVPTPGPTEAVAAIEDPPEQADGDAEEAVVAIEEVAAEPLPADDAREQGAEQISQQEPPADALDAAVIGDLTGSELSEARQAWLADGRERLVRAADRRIQQLRLRSLFTEQ
ncbi:MAG: hypothetical protein AAF937_02120 [Planctomycetota bacterium]